MSAQTFFQLSAKDAKHNDVDFAAFEGKPVLVVNVASKCGSTPQYEGLEKLYAQYKDHGLVVVGFPCNQFGQEEPGTEAEILSFCKLNFGVTFPIMAKTDVNGAGTHPVYQWLKAQAQLPALGDGIKWNFEKFLVARSGRAVTRYETKVTPDEIAKDIALELAGSA